MNEAPERVTDVVSLMCVRQMPEPDFRDLCERILGSKGKPLVTTCDKPSLLVRNSPYQSVMVRRCRICDAVIDDPALARAAEVAAGFPACKGCVDEALVSLFGPELRTHSVVGHALLELAVRARD